MRITTTLLLVVLSLLLIPKLGNSQCSTTPCITPTPSVNAQDACILPNPGALDCYYGETTADPPVSFPPYWCSAIHNNHFFAFTADANTATFDLSCYGCAVGNGIQAAVLATADCVNFTFVSPCLGNIPSGTTQTLVATGLTPGQNYYLCIDGSSGAQCEYSINGTLPTIMISGPPEICIPSSPQVNYTTTGNSIWTINPPGAGSILGSSVGTGITVNWLQQGPAQVCAQGIDCPNAPVECLDVYIGEDTYASEEVELCQGKSVTCAGRTFTAPGSFPVTLTSFSGCDSVVTCVVTLIPTVTTTENHNLCQGQAVSCAGQEFFAPGLFPVTLTTDKGCDSIVRCNIKLIPTYISPFTMVNLCGPADYYVCDNIFQSTGIYTEICTSVLGCDSIINVNLAILEPESVIAPPGILDCDSNAVITLNGSGSPVNPATGGITLYQWTGIGIVGASNLPNVQVNQPGEYCLVVSHGRGGVYCTDTTCVTVTANSALPQMPQISGNTNPCGDSTVIYSATAVGTPPPSSYTWTTPNNYPYSTLTPNSIQITWDTLLTGGQLCVTAQNSCGSSAPACLPINVLEALLPPQFAGPDTVCAGGGSYTFILDTLQVGTNYSWTTPPGATISGSLDTVQINFQNASSGKVCVTAQNACGTGAPICLDVQVMPVPTANLTGTGEICLGDSIPLSFALTGNAPYDVVWSNGTQNFTLSNIQNGHIVKVSPAQSTTYHLVSVSDNSAPEACAAIATDSVIVTVWMPASTTATAEICQGASILLGGAQQTSSGVYIDSLQTLHGCDSILSTTLTVFTIDTLVLNLSSCDPSATGTTTQILSQVNGCDSIVITNTTLLPTDTTTITGNSCNPANVGTFIQNLTNGYGCDSTVITTIAYSQSDTTYLTDTSCDPNATGVFNQLFTNSENCDSLVITTVSYLQSDTTQLFGQSCNPSNVGTFPVLLINQEGCDSLVLTTIIFSGIPATNLTATTCDPNAAGVFSQTLVTAGGCDSTIITTVSLLPSDTTQLAALTCNPANVGAFPQIFTNQYGCDSTVIITVSFSGIPATNLTATSCDPNAVGVFSQTLVTAGGCDSTIITTVSLLPSDTTQLTAQSCNPANVGAFPQVFTNQYGCDSTVITTVSFSGIPVTNLNATTCDPNAAGVFSQTIVTAGGCDSTIVTTVALLPSSQTTLQSTTCDPSAAGVFIALLTNQFGCDSTVTEIVNLLPSDTTYLTASTCEPSEVGIVMTIASNQYGCDSTIVLATSLLPAAACGTSATASGSTIPCGSNTGSLTLTPTLGIPPFDYRILLAGTQVNSGALTTVGTSQTVTNLAPGNYTIIFTASTGYSDTLQASIVQLIPPVLTAQAASSFNGFPISCTGAADGSASATLSGGLPQFNFVWSNGGTTAQINNLGPGAYTVTVTDANNCTATGSVSLTEPALLQMNFTVNNVDCSGQNNGAITIVPSGGVSPYRYSLNGGATQSAGLFKNLAADTYGVQVFDANDCQVGENILVKAPTVLTVDLGSDQTISQGETATLQALINLPLDSITSVVWTPAFDSSACPGCLTQTVMPLVTTAYSIAVSSSNGCHDDDRILVIVDRRRQVYVPNIFSPNDDGVNELLNIFAKPGSVRNIKTFQVYSRWGESLYSLEDFLPNDELIGWNGKYRGQQMNPGVYVWMMEVEFIDGVTELYKGDVTLYR